MADSADLSEAVHDILNTWLQGKTGAFLVGSVGILEAVDSEGKRQVLFFESPEQTPAMTLGLLRYATLWAESRADQDLLPLVWDEAGEDEE